eukprot:1080820-Prymnesium_polylepis.1
MMNNVLANPSEPKYRKIRISNANFQAKVYSCGPRKSPSRTVAAPSALSISTSSPRRVPRTQRRP